MDKYLISKKNIKILTYLLHEYSMYKYYYLFIIYLNYKYENDLLLLYTSYIIN